MAPRAKTSGRVGEKSCYLSLLGIEPCFFCSPGPWHSHCTDRDAVGKITNSLISFNVYRVSHVATDNHQVIVYWIVWSKHLCIYMTRISSRRLEQCFSTAGPRHGTGPWLQLYRAAKGSGICHFSILSSFHQ